ncbi:histone H1 [Candidatus Rariloculus sp.]|uniref:histone H1 n=1 Tax=Candidatus Rariloculus sp. TaxID=3101265 RepID=UPI003D12FAC5
MREDTNQRAKRVVDIATGQRPKPPNKPNGRQIGGYARASRMTPERRKEIAKKAAAARWANR